MSLIDLALNRCVVPADQKQGAAQRVQELYDEHYAACYRFLVFDGATSDESIDFLQEAFLRLYQSLKSGTRIENPRAWLIRVLQRLRIDEFRRTARECALVDFPEDVLPGVQVAENPESELLGLERSRQLEQAVRQLTKRQYQYLALRAEGMKFREIAETFDVSIGSVSDACARALKKLGKLANA